MHLQTAVFKNPRADVVLHFTGGTRANKYSQQTFSQIKTSKYNKDPAKDVRLEEGYLNSTEEKRGQSIIYSQIGDLY